MARKPAKRKPSTSASESESVFDPPAQEPNDAEEETLGPRSSKLLAHKKWEELKPKSSKADQKRKASHKEKSENTGAKTGSKKGAGGPSKKGAKAGLKKVANDVGTYRAPESIQLNTSEDSTDDIPEGSQASRKSTKEVLKSTSSRMENADKGSSHSNVKMPVRSSSRRSKRKSDEDELSEGVDSEDEEEEEEDEDKDEDEGAIVFDAEALHWVDPNNAEDLDDAAASDRLTPPRRKHHRCESDSEDGGKESTPIRAPSHKKTKPDPEDTRKKDEDDSHIDRDKPTKEKLMAKGRGGDGQSDAGDSEEERARARARVKQKQRKEARHKDKEQVKAKASEENPKVAVLRAGRPADLKSQGSDGKRKGSASKRKHAESAAKEKSDVSEDDEAAAPPKKPRADFHSDSDKDEDEEIDDHDTNISLQYDKKGRPNLGEQAPRVRRIARLAIFLVKKNVLLKCAFPDGIKDLQDQARSALIQCAQDAGYRDMVKRLKDDNQEEYWRKFATLPAQRAFSLRGLVKKITDGAVAGVYGLQPGNAEKVEWLQRNLTFIYLHDYKELQVQSQGKLAFTLPIFESVLRTSFYDNPRSFGYKVLNCFESSLLERPQEKEIPTSMLALVAKAVYASLDDYRPTKYRAGKFEANIYTPVFKHCISFLSKMKSKQPNKYHVLMHGLYQRLTGAAPGIADLDNDAFADFSADEE